MTTSDDKKKKIEQIKLMAAVLLVIGFAISFTTHVVFRKQPAPVPDDPAVTVSAADTTDLSSQLIAVTNIRTNDALRKEQRAVWEKEWGRDPFVPQATISTVVKAVNLILRGILWDEKNPKVIINDKTLAVGDTIYGYSVEKITPKSVTLKTGEKHLELFVFSTAF